jgi:hypothetical protein
MFTLLPYAKNQKDGEPGKICYSPSERKGMFINQRTIKKQENV